MALLSAPDAVCVFSTLNALSLRINWSVVDDALSYKVYRSPVPHDEFALVASVVGLTLFDNPQSADLSLNLDNRWYYRVSTVSGDGEGALSGPSTFRPYEVFSQAMVPLPGLSHFQLMN
jgi:uncharacterized membrane protein